MKEVLEGEPGHTSISGANKMTVPLYSENGTPLWHQQEPPDMPHADINAIGLRVPQFLDAVALPINLEPNTTRFLAFNKSQIASTSTGGYRPTTHLTIIGYPYGYSVFDVASPEPVFVTRSIAAAVTMRPYQILLDGIGARGMSGSPVLSQDKNGKFRLEGIYTGAINPSIVGHDHDLYASLGAIATASALAHIPELDM